MTDANTSLMIHGDVILNEGPITVDRIDLGAVDYSTEALQSPPIFEIAAFLSEVDTQLESLDAAPDSLSPHHYEQNARELLIERERQSRLERERARLKRHLALSRDRQEEEDNDDGEQSGFGHDPGSWRSQNETEFSAEDFVVMSTSNHRRHNHIDSEIGDNKSAVCTVGDASEILSTHPSHDGRILDHSYGYVMERFLSENSGGMERSNHPMEVLNEIDPVLQHASSFDRTDSREFRSVNILTHDDDHFLSGYNDSRFPLSFTAELHTVGASNTDDDSNQLQRMSEHDVRVDNDDDHDDNDVHIHDGSSHSNLVGSDDEGNSVHLDDDEDGSQSDLDDGVSYNHSRLGHHSDVLDYTSSIGNMSTHSTHGESIPHFQSLSNFDFRPMSNILSEGTHTTVQESISASSVHGRMTDAHPSFSLLDDQANFQPLSIEALEESDSIVSITSVVANVSVHSDESNIPLSIPRSRRNTHDEIIQITVQLDSSEIRSDHSSRRGGNDYELDYESVDSGHSSSIGIGKHPLSESSREYDMRISGRSYRMKESYGSRRYGVADVNRTHSDEFHSSTKTSHKLPSTVVSYQQRRKSIDSVFDLSFCSHETHSLNQVYENTMDRRQQFIEQKLLAIVFPKRIRQLVITIMIEIPVFIIIMSGSGKLSRLVGQSKFQLIMSILPMSSAICRMYGSGIGKSMSKATTSSYVPEDLYLAVIAMESGMLVCLSLCIGILLGLMIYSLTFDFGFGMAIGVSVTFQMLIGGLLAFLSPFLFRAKFNAIFGSAIQDIVGSFTMVLLCYQVLLLLNVQEPSFDTCT